MAGQLWKVDGQISVTSSVVRFAFELERQIEALFFDLVLGRRQKPNVQPRLKYKSGSMLREHVLQSRKYVDWLPYNLTLDRAKLHLRGGRPFTTLSRDGKRAFEEMSLIRNVLAHEGTHANNRFLQDVVNAANRTVPKHEHKVERYLISQPSPGTSRLQEHMNECVKALKELG